MRLVMVVLMLVASAAHAERHDRARDEATRTSWPAPDAQLENYGWRIAAVDGVSVGLVGGGVALLTQVDSDVRYLGVFPIMAGTIGYWALSPMIHVRYGRQWTASASSAMRVVLPFTGMMIGANLVTCPTEGETCDKQWIAGVLGTAAGVLIPTSLDAFVFGQGGKRITVYAMPSVGGASLGFAGQF